MSNSGVGGGGMVSKWGFSPEPEEGRGHELDPSPPPQIAFLPACTLGAAGWEGRAEFSFLFSV